MEQRKSRMRPGWRTVSVAAGVVVVGMLAVGLRAASADDTAAADAAGNLAAGRAATGSAPCRAAEGPEKAVNGSTGRGLGDKWCSRAAAPYLRVDLGSTARIGKIRVRHAGGGHERSAWNTRDFAISASTDGASYTRIVDVTGNTADVTETVVSGGVPARYLRLDVVTPTSTGDRAARIYEFEAYAAPAGSASPSRPASASPSHAAPSSPPGTAAPTHTTAPPTTPSCHPDAPVSLTDYVSDHRDAMSRVACNADVAVYFDADLAALPASGTGWITPFVTDVWRHMKRTYGTCAVPRSLPAPIGPGCEDFGAPKPALALLHQGRHGGGTVANRFDSFAGFRTTIDVGDTGWSAGNATLHDEIVHEACHQVEGAGQGVHESPAFSVWGDSKWAEFCLYDFYARTGRGADADRVYQLFTGHRDNLPAGARGAAWFRDWFYPMWKDGGNDAAAMTRFFGLLSQYFPTRTENGGRNLIYTRRMTTGEFVHFSSAAAGKDLSARAATAFGAGFSRAEFDKARADFPQLRY